MTANGSDSGTVSLLLGNGNGTFAAHKDFSTGSWTWPELVTVADFNGDNKLDLAVSFLSPAYRIDVMLGDGVGGFAPAVEIYQSPYYQCSSLAIGDFNRDGKQDLVSAFDRAFVSVFLGKGDGTFAAPKDFATSANSGSVAVGDLNKDGKQDLVVANGDIGTVSVLLGDGEGGFAAKTDFAAGTYPAAPAIGDLNGDGRQDVATVNSGLGTVSLLLGNGGGGLAPRVVFPTGTSVPQSVTLADFNGDGRQDLVTANGGNSGDTVSVLLQPPSKPQLGKPACPRAVKHGVRFKVSGTLRPQFAAGLKTVKVKAYRLASGKWRRYKTYWAVNGDFSSYTRYAATVTITRKGKYRFKAFTAATTEWLAARTGFSKTLTVK